MRKHLFSTLFILTSCLYTSAQLVDDFSDGDFTQNPIWTGETALFQISADLQLQTNGMSASDVIHLVSPSTRIDATEWRFRLTYNSGPSGSNLMRIYLVSDQENLEGDLLGYFIGIGETGSGDSIDLFRQDGNSTEKIIDGITGTVGAGVNAYIRVLRDALGNWEVYADPSGGDSFQLQGAVTDNTYTQTNFFGVYVKHTTSRRASFFFDDIFVGEEFVDTKPPTALQATILSDTEIELLFSEALDLASAENAANYSLDNGIGSPSVAQLDAGNPALVRLSFGQAFQNNTTYTLNVEGVSDIAGNEMLAQASFLLFYFVAEEAEFKDVILTEIFPDPSPPLGLPNTEFLEIYNRSDKAIDLEGWKLDNGTTTGTLPAYALLAGEYVILTKSSDVSFFVDFGEVTSPSTWPSLVNSGDNLTLVSNQGVLIDKVDYLSSWYGDANKDDGGYSLELINPDKLDCPAMTNWTVSASPSGGTPGKINSVFSLQADSNPPSLIDAVVLDSRRIQLCFDESMDAASLSEIANYSIDQGIGTPSNALAVDPDFLCVELTLLVPIQAGIIYTVSVDRLADCSGNVINTIQTAAFVEGQAAQEFEVVINEIFPDPSPQRTLPEAEFIEIHNRTDKVLDISGWSISDGSRTGTWGAATILPNEYFIVCAQAFAADFAAFGKVLAVSSFPSLGNTTDTLFLQSDIGFVMDYVFYHKSWFRDESKDAGGWTLERVDPDFVDCNQAGNWRASEDESGGTPGRANSVLGVFEDTDAPTISGILVESMAITLFFSEQMDENTLSNIENYRFDQGLGQPLLAFPVPPVFNSAQILLNDPLLEGIIYELSYQGLSDCAGNEISGSTQVGIPQSAQKGDVLINEILFNPLSGGSDFVEVYNASNKILDLSTLFIGEVDAANDSIFNSHVLSERPSIFLPGQLLCLSKDIVSQQQIYQTPLHAQFLGMSDFPSYADNEGECIVFTISDTLDRFYYEDDFHFPTLDNDDGVSLERISLKDPTQNAGNWHSAASTVNYATPGYKNSQGLVLDGIPSEVSLEKQTFSPNGDGMDDVLAINYDFDFIGGNARLSIFDSQGRMIRMLQNNILLSAEAGTFFWDGRDAKNTKADIGIYVVLFEVTNQQTGKKQAYKLACVLADVL